MKPGDLVIIPKGTPHAGTKPDGRTIKAIAIKTPPQAPDDYEDAELTRSVIAGLAPRGAPRNDSYTCPRPPAALGRQIRSRHSITSAAATSSSTMQTANATP